MASGQVANLFEHPLLRGLGGVWAETKGDPAIRIAIVDGPVDTSHPCFEGADLNVFKPALERSEFVPAGTAHGTHIAGVIFGQPRSCMQGIAPRCHGLIVPIFSDAPNGGVTPASEADVTDAILLAMDNGAHVINISAGVLGSPEKADQSLVSAVETCAEKGVLIVAAAGNDGCECLHLPAALPSVLAVGALADDGSPGEFSNWGDSYRNNGILAAGTDIPGAAPGGGTTIASGTSFATPVVSGVAGLLLSLQRMRGGDPDPIEARDLLLSTATTCNPQSEDDCRRFLAGTLNISVSRQKTLAEF